MIRQKKDPDKQGDQEIKGQSSGRRKGLSVGASSEPETSPSHAISADNNNYKPLAENNPDMMLVVREDATIVYAAPSFKRLLGHGPRESVGRSLLDHIAPEAKEKVDNRLRQAAAIPGHTLSFDVDLHTKKGSWRTVEVVARNMLHVPDIGGLILNGRDITERIKEQERLRKDCDELEARVRERTAELRQAYERLEKEIGARQEADEERTRLSTAIERGGDCVIITDRSWRIQYVNPAFEKISLYAREDITGHPLETLQNNENARFWSEMWNALKSGVGWTGRTTNARKDGSTYEVERTISPIKDDKGVVTNFVSVERDMTKQEGLEAELRHAQRMQAIGTLAGGIAHDFNNILAAMIGFTELAIDDVEDNARAVRHLEQVRKAGYRGRELVKQILTFSRQSEQEKKPVQVAPIVREVAKLIRASLPSSIDVRLRMDTEEAIILADPVQIHQLLINLCTNAGQAMRSRSGVLEVRVSDFSLDSLGDPPHPDMEPGPYVKLSVSDTGPGIDSLIKDRIFEPFFTTRRESAGMGLSVVYGIVKSHNGAITTSSAPGRGSTFTVYFSKVKPLANEVVAAPAKPTKGKGRILFVDDEEALVEIAKQMLERLGYEVTAENDSLKALKQFQRDPEKFDLVITDQTMLNMTGIELAKKLMTIKKDIPIILCTGFSEVISPETAKALGIREFVMKPIIKNEMAATIRRVIDTGQGEKKG
jgi:PAS domain S-box-containing protein